MTITILIQNVEIMDGEIEKFSFEEKETVHEALLRYLTSKNYPDILESGRCFFRFGNKVISTQENLKNKLSNLVKNNQLLEFGIKRNDNKEEHLYSEEAFDFANVTKGPTKRDCTAKDAPDYRYVGRGLNIYGTCVFKKCDLFQKNVIVMMRKCKVDLGSDVYGNDIPCPHCSVNVKPITCGFHMCKYKIGGRMVEGKEVKDIPEINDVANDENSSNYYNPDFTGMSKFLSLSIEVTELLDYKKN